MVCNVKNVVYDVRLAASLKAKVEDYLPKGGKILATGEFGLNEAGDAFAVDFVIKYAGRKSIINTFMLTPPRAA